MNKTESIIVAESLKKDYKSGKVVVPAVREATFTVKPGERIALVGPSGSGKSTLLNLLGGLDRPTSGRLVVDGHNLSAAKDKEAAVYRQSSVGMIFQSFNLLAHLTAMQNVLLPAVLAGTSRAEALRRAAELFDRVKLADQRQRMPDELSGGEQQRVAIVRALMNKPRVLLTDEPTGNLDSATGLEVMKLLLETTESSHAALMIVTHDEHIAGMMQRKLTIVDGRLQSDGGAA